MVMGCLLSRVQSVALRLVVEKEEDREAFQSEE
jgi:DNA topoisomerase IA